MAEDGARLFMSNSNRRTKCDLRASMIDGAAFGGMVGFGETYLPAFALAAGLGEMVAGLTGSLPLLAGGVMQLISPHAVRQLRSHRRWVVACAAIQALVFIPLVIASITGTATAGVVLLSAAVYWAAGLATGPAWNTWIGSLVPGALRARFFARRTWVSQACVFAGFLGGGLLLQATSERGLQAFALLFTLAGLCRLVSVVALYWHSEPVPMHATMKQIPWRRVWHHLQASSGGKLLLYLVVVQAAVQMAGPFFTPFMLQKLQFGYGELAGLLSLAFLAKVFSLAWWGRVARIIGARNLLWIGGVGIVPLSFGWVVSQDLAWLGVVQIVSGVLWAAYELAFFLLFFESIPDEERTSVLTFYNLLNAIAWVCGSLLGAALLWASEFSFNSYLMLFGLSSLGRLLAVVLLVRVPRVVVLADAVGVRTVAVRPGNASLDAPVLPSLPDRLVDES